MRALGVDLGRARIGLACAEREAGVASPRRPLAASGTLRTDARAIAEAAKREEAAVVVVGLALDSGGETAMSRAARRLGSELEALGWRVEFVDESMTSQSAESDMAEAGLTAAQRRKAVDGEAACRILERWMSGG
jgi:putative holliday junction resolvase